MKPLHKNIVIVSIILLLIATLIIIYHNTKASDEVKKWISSHKDNIVYWQKNKIYFFRINRIYNIKSELDTYVLGIGEKVFANGYFAEKEYLDYGPMRYYKHNFNVNNDLKIIDYFSSKPIYTKLSREICDEFGINYKAFNGDYNPSMEKTVTIWDDCIITTHPVKDEKSPKEIKYYYYIYNFDGIEIDLIDEDEYFIDCDYVLDAEIQNKPKYIFDEKNELLYIFYKDQFGVFLRVLGHKE